MLCYSCREASRLEVTLTESKRNCTIFFDCGHNNHAKSVWLHLQQMSTLEKEITEVYCDFVNSCHDIRRRSERVWSGLSHDLMSEQTLRISLNSTGSLTRGLGFKAPYAKISAAIEEFTGKKPFWADMY